MKQALRLLLATVLAVALSCSDSDTRHGAPGGRVSVQSAWQSARLTRGHQLHVVQEHVACAQCHELNADSVGLATPARCAACHLQESQISHAETAAAKRFGDKTKADCTACHAFSAPKVEAAKRALTDGGVSHADFAPADCARCHSAKLGETAAVVVHGGSECVSCHRPHEDAKPQPGPCVDCHREVETSHAALGKSHQQACTTCHVRQHGPASEALETCATCHAKEHPLVPKSALFEKGHDECVTCHAPHDFEKQATLPCRSCHAEVNVLAASSVPAHNQCASCHSPHDVRGSQERACANCHAGVHPNHPKLAGAGACVGCHDPHPAQGQSHELARSCSGCHKAAHTEQDFHAGVACTQCHKPHAFALGKADRSLCSGCHAQEAGRVAKRSGHQDCAGCHGGLPHHPSTLENCQSCHARVQHQVTPGHARCTSCHEPHSGSQVTPCASCHQPEAKSAPAGHSQCIKCHQPHTGSAAGASCASCHGAEARSSHGQLAVGCEGCHRPHGPSGVASPPACASCHKPASLRGLHQEPKHQDCGRCHTGHGDKPSIARDACLTCHVDRKSHFPNAARCSSCHLFDTPR